MYILKSGDQLDLSWSLVERPKNMMMIVFDVCHTFMFETGIQLSAAAFKLLALNPTNPKVHGTGSCYAWIEGGCAVHYLMQHYMPSLP